MAFVPFSTCVLMTVLSTSQMILGNPIAPIIARNPRDHQIYSPPIQYVTDLFKDNLFDYSKFFTDYDYQTGARNPERAYPNDNDYQNQQQGYQYLPNQAYQTSQNSPSQGLGGYPVNFPNQLDYNTEQTINANPNLLEMIPFLGGYFSEQPSRSQQTSHRYPKHTNPNQLHKPIPKVQIIPSYYQTVPLSKPNIPNNPIIANANAQNFLLTLASNPTLLSQVQSLLQSQKQEALQPSTESLTDSLQTPNAHPQELPAPLKTNSPAMAQTQETNSPTVPVATAATPNPSQTLTTPRPLTDAKAPTPDTLSPPKESHSVPLTPSGTQQPTTLPAGNVPLTASLPAPSPVPSPPLAIPISGSQ